MKKLMWIMSIAPLVITAIVLQFMPERVPMHYDMAGNVDRWGSRYESLLMPIFILVLAFFMSLFIGFFERKANKTEDDKERAGAISNARVLGIVGTVMSVMFGVMQCAILYGAYTGAKAEATTATVDIGKVSCILLGVMLIVMGNYMTKTRINGAVGVRISWSVYNDTTWKKSNRFGAIVFILAGLFTILTAVWMKSSFGATMAFLGYLCLATLLTMAYAHRVYVQEIESERKRGD